MVASSQREQAPKSRTLDVRALIARGEEPFPQVMAVVRETKPGEEFILITPFLPAPLIERLQADGYAIRPEYRADGGWQTHCRKPIT